MMAGETVVVAALGFVVDGWWLVVDGCGDMVGAWCGVVLAGSVLSYESYRFVM